MALRTSETNSAAAAPRLLVRGGLRAAGGRQTHISVVVPMYGCALCVDELHRRLVASIEPISADFEIILVNDASPDDTWPRICALARRDSRVKGMNLFSEFRSALRHCRRSREHLGRVDGGDGLRPSEPARGHPAVICTCGGEVTTPFSAVASIGRTASSRSWPGRAFNIVIGYLTDTKADPRVCNFSIISRRIVDAYCLYSERRRAYVPNVVWLGFPTTYPGTLGTRSGTRARPPTRSAGRYGSRSTTSSRNRTNRCVWRSISGSVSPCLLVCTGRIWSRGSCSGRFRRPAGRA